MGWFDDVYNMPYTYIFELFPRFMSVFPLKFNTYGEKAVGNALKNRNLKKRIHPAYFGKQPKYPLKSVSDIN